MYISNCIDLDQDPQSCIQQHCRVFMDRRHCWPGKGHEAFAACILMLPAHSRAGSKDIANIRRVLCSG
jgi:hypothetical protein